MTPTIQLRDVYFGNAKWSKEAPAMARIEKLEFSIALRDLPEKILVPRVALTRPELVFERLPDNRKNWILSDPSDTSPSKLRISTLSVDHGKLRYIDHGVPFAIDVQGSTFDPSAPEKVKDAAAKPSNNRYTTQYDFKGKYHDAAFSGRALTGDVLSFQESGVSFPLKGELDAGTDEARGGRQHRRCRQHLGHRHAVAHRRPDAGQPVSLPAPAAAGVSAVPPARVTSSSRATATRWTTWPARSVRPMSPARAPTSRRKPRPLLSADLHSKLLNLADLGPLIGVQTKETGGKPAASQAETSNRPAAKAKEKATDPTHLLPAGSFDGSRLQKIDARGGSDRHQAGGAPLSAAREPQGLAAPA